MSIIRDKPIGLHVPDVRMEAERAYRRGCLQVIEYLKEEFMAQIDEAVKEERPELLHQRFSDVVALWHQELMCGRESADVAYLGHYLDVVRQKVHKRMKKV